MNSRQKGAGGERELSRVLREHRYNCRRGLGCIPQEEPEGWLVTMNLGDWIKMYAASRITADITVNSSK